MPYHNNDQNWEYGIIVLTNHKLLWVGKIKYRTNTKYQDIVNIFSLYIQVLVFW
jgi:hypothetical protein